MAKNLSAIKRAKISLRNRSRNRKYKSAIKTYTKKYLLSLQNLNNNEITDSNDTILKLSLAYQAIDKAVKRGVLHKNTGARKKSILARAQYIRKNS